MIYQKPVIRKALSGMSRVKRGGLSMQEIRKMTSEKIKGPVTRRTLKKFLRGEEGLSRQKTKRILSAVEAAAHPAKPTPQAQEKRAPAPRFVPQPQKPKPTPVMPQGHKAPIVKPTLEPKKGSLFSPKPGKTIVPEWMKGVSRPGKEAHRETAAMPGHLTGGRAEAKKEETDKDKLTSTAPKSFVPRFAGTSAEMRPDLGKPTEAVGEDNKSAPVAPSAPTERESPAPAPSTKSAEEIDTEMAAEESSVDTAMDATFGGGSEEK